MQKIQLPYGKGYQTLEIEESALRAVLTPPKEPAQNRSEQEIVEDALRNCYDSPRLNALARGKKRCVIITSDHTRSMPSRITMPLLLRELREGNPNLEITILIATGLHRAMTEQEIRNRFGDEIAKSVRIVCHNAYADAEMEFVCTLPSGNPLEVNRLARQADLLVCEGFVEPHLFAGFSGGRKAILPGISSVRSVNHNHCAHAIAHPRSHTGLLQGNMIHEDMVCAARKVGVDFILNVALNRSKQITAAFAGDLEAAHAHACQYVSKYAAVAGVKGDIAITTNGGYPLDQNLYQACKGISTAACCTHPGSIIIMVCACEDGLGGEHFGKILRAAGPRETLKRICSTGHEDTIPEQWCNQIISKAMLDRRLFLVSEHLSPEDLGRSEIELFDSVQHAYSAAQAAFHGNASVVVIPDGVGTIVYE